MATPTKWYRALASPRGMFWLELSVFLLGFILRVEHAVTFDGPLRGSDYGAHLQGVRWMQENWRVFDYHPEVNPQANFYPPLWYAASALLLEYGLREKAIASFAVAAWVVRHVLLGRILSELIPGAPFARACALLIHAALPLSVLIDGKVNPEGMHSGFFMLGAYYLFRIEREASGPGPVSLRSAALFGLFSGLAVITKASGGMLTLVGLVVFAVRAGYLVLTRGFGVGLGPLLRPTVVAMLVWCAVAGFWCGPNLIKYGHPFPHPWDIDRAMPVQLESPKLYRRPLGWALPFYWKEYWDFPILRNTQEPLPNFWAAEISGTWADFYNRGFCRLQGGAVDDRVWGAARGFMPHDSPIYSVSTRCVAMFAKLLHVGVWMTLAATLAVFYTAWRAFRSRFRSGSVGLPTMVVGCVLSGMVFALFYPFDNIAVLNPRYLLPAVTPMCVCVALGLARLEGVTRARGLAGGLAALALALSAGSIAFVTAMLLFIRFGS